MITVDRTATGAPRLTILELGSVELTEDQLRDLAQATCDLLTTGTRAADAAVLMSPGRVRERELPGLRERRGEHLAAWVAEHGGAS